MKNPMMTAITQLNYKGDALVELIDLLDTLHSAASDGQIQHFTTLSEQDLVGLLREAIFTAQETIAEIESHRLARRPAQILHLVDAQERLA